MEAELFYKDDCTLGEGPFWYDDRLWWVDIERGSLRSVNGEAADFRSVEVGRKLGTVAPMGGNRFTVAMQDGFGVLEWEGAAVSLHHDPEAHLPDNRFNDGKADPRGRFVAGTMGKARSGALYLLDLDGSTRKLLEGISISNGLAWSSDGLRFFYIDTPTRLLRAFDYDLDRGTISNERVIREFAPELGSPDGMTIDAEDHLWVAFWDGAAIRCIDSVNGAQLDEIRVPADRTTSCTFGGPELRDLFITTAGFGIRDDQPDAGSIFVCRPGVIGTATNLCEVVFG